LRETGNLWSNWPGWDVYPQRFADAGYAVGHALKGWAPGRREDMADNPAGPRFGDFREFMSDAGDDPFCFWYGSHHPHRAYVEGSGVQSGMSIDDVEVPPFWPDAPAVRADILDYYLECQMFDDQIAELLATLERTGRLDNTLIVCCGDNGWPFPRAKANLYDHGTRMPLAIAWPGVIEGGRTIDDFVNFADFAPTFLEAAGLDPLPDASGKSLVDVLTSNRSGRVDPARDRIFCGRERHAWARHGNVGYPMRMVRSYDHMYIRNFEPDRWPAGDPPGYRDIDPGLTKQYMMDNRDLPEVAPLFDLAFGKRPAEELYDVRADPCQMVNLAGLPEYDEVRRRMLGELEHHLSVTGDPRLSGDFDFDAQTYYGASTWAPRPMPKVFDPRRT